MVGCLSFLRMCFGFGRSRTCTAVYKSTGSGAEAEESLRWKCCRCGTKNGLNNEWELLCVSCGHSFDLCFSAERMRRLT